MHTNLPMLNPSEVADLLQSAIGNVSYQSDANFLGVKTTAFVSSGQWTRKSFASDVMAEIRQAELAAIPKPPRAILKPSPRTIPYTGPLPRKRHSHRCVHCDDRAVACYKQHCTKPQLTNSCYCCKDRYRG